MMPNPLVWLALSTLGMIGAIFRLPSNGWLSKFCRRFAAFFQFGELLAWLAKSQARKTLLTTCLIGVIVLSISLQVTEQAFGSTVTTTRTTQSLTSTRYTTSMATDTSTFMKTKTSFTTITPTSTVTVDRRTTTTVYATTTKTVQKVGGIVVTIELDETFQDEYGDYRYYIRHLQAYTSDPWPHEFSFFYPTVTFPPEVQSVTVPSDCGVLSNCIADQLVPTDPALQPIKFDVGVSGEDASLKPLTFTIDLSDLKEDRMTIFLGKKEFDEVYISRIEPPAIKPVSQGLERYLEIRASEPRGDLLNGLRALLGWGRIYYYDVTVKVDGASPYSAIITTFTSSVDRIEEFKRPKYELKETPALEGELQRSYDDIAEAAFGGGPAGIGSGAVETALAFAEKSPLAYFYLKDVADGTIGEIRKQYERHEGQDLTTSGGCFTVAPRIRVRPFMIGLGELYVSPILKPGEVAKFTVTFEETRARSAAGIKPIFMVTFTGVERLVKYETVKWGFLEHYVNALLSLEAHVSSFTYGSNEVVAEAIPA
jgi:hypothetical protein